MEILISFGVFLLVLLFIHQGYGFIKKVYKPEQKKTRDRLKIFSMSGHGNEPVDIRKKKTLSEIPWLNKILLKATFVSRLERLHVQASASHPLGFYVMLSALLFFSGCFLAIMTNKSLFAMVLPSALLATTPFLYLAHKRKKRMGKFEMQLPEALELVARALKAGHAFTGGLKMVADEFGDPVGVEFGKTLNEINFGMAVPEALTNLTQRVHCDDLKFFAVSVSIQRETGGNLAEILDNLGRLIRERFKFQGRVRVLSAEGRISAIVLVAVPFLVTAFLSLFRPEYINTLFTDAIGRTLVLVALVMMSVGIYVMKKIVTIKA